MLFEDLKEYGPLNSKVIQDYINISNLHEYLRDYKKALDNHNQALKSLKQIHKEMHPSVAIILSDIGRLNSKMGSNEEGLKHCTEAYDFLVKNFGQSHPEVLVTLNDMGDINYRLFQYQEALRIYDQLLTLYSERGGLNQRAIALNLNKKGSVYLEIKDFKKAIEHFEKAYGILSNVYGSQSHPELSIILDDMALAYEVSGSKDKALEFYLKALEINEKFELERPESKLHSFNQIGRLYSRIGTHDKAIEYFEKALEFAQTSLKSNPCLAGTEYSILAICYERMGNLDKALEDIEKAIQIEGKYKGETTKDFALNLSHKGRFMALKGSVLEGLTICNEALAIMEKIGALNTPEGGRINHDIGRCYIIKGDLRKAQRCLHKGVKSLEKTLGSDELFLGYCLKDAAEVEFKLGNRAIGRALLKNTFKIFKHFLGKDNQVVQDSVRLGEEWEKQGLMEKSHTKMF